MRDIKNQWGVQGGQNPQRADLWQADLASVITNLNRSDPFNPQLQNLPRYVPCAVSLPELKIKPEPYRRDSRSYQMPSVDEPLDPVRISFIMDDGGFINRQNNDISASEIYRVMDVWRRVSRAGRGALGSELFLVLDANYTVAFRFSIYLYLCRGNSLPSSATTGGTTLNGGTTSQQATFDATARSNQLVSQVQVLQSRAAALDQTLVGLEVTNIFMLENAWLSGFKIGDLNYEAAKVLTLDATIYAENIFQFQRGSGAPVTL